MPDHASSTVITRHKDVKCNWKALSTNTWNFFSNRSLQTFPGSIEQRHYNDSFLKFLSHFSSSVNRATLRQTFHLSNKELVGYSLLLGFITTETSTRLSGDNFMAITNEAFNDGFPLLQNPMVTTEHTAGKQLRLSILFTVPELPTIIYFSLSNTCLQSKSYNWYFGHVLYVTHPCL